MPKISKEKEKKIDKKDVVINKISKKVSSKESISSSKKTNTSSKKPNSSKKSSTTSSKNISPKKASISSKKPNYSTKKDSSSAKSKLNSFEYYDLPYKYNNTLVKLLAQTPKTLFVYWEVSDLDISNYKKLYGENFFNITKPILIVHNLTLNKTYEVEINDFANCWYLTTEDSYCKFDIILARKFNSNFKDEINRCLHISKSNELQSPNDHILFEKLTNNITFKDVKTGNVITKNIHSFDFLNNLYEFYKKMYADDILKNPSSNF